MASVKFPETPPSPLQSPRRKEWRTAQQWPSGALFRASGVPLFWWWGGMTSKKNVLLHLHFF